VNGNDLETCLSDFTTGHTWGSPTSVTGNRVLDRVAIVCIFYDPYGHAILRERVAIVSRKMGKLAPGESKPFRLAFDNVPDGWNETMPQMVIAAIDFT